MNTKEKAPISAATLTEAAETAGFGGAANSYYYLSTTVAGRQRKVSDLLSRGRENAVPLRHLKQIMETDGRTIRLMIQRERLEGIPICADNLTGYFLPSTEDEKTACVRSMRHRAGEIMRTAQAIERGVALD